MEPIYGPSAEIVLRVGLFVLVLVIVVLALTVRRGR